MTTPESEPSRDYLLADSFYHGFRILSQYVLPVEMLVIFAIAVIWELDAVDWLLGFLIIADVIFGIVLGVAQRSYERSGAKYDGTIDVKLASHGGKIFSLNLDSDPNDLDAKDHVTFKVNPS